VAVWWGDDGCLLSGSESVWGGIVYSLSSSLGW